jgi:hypothetical protein
VSLKLLERLSSIYTWIVAMKKKLLLIMEQKLSQPFLKNSLGLYVLTKAINLDLSYINKNYFYIVRKLP